MNHLLFLGLVASLACFIIWNLVIDKLGNVTSTNYVYLNRPGSQSVDIQRDAENKSANFGDLFSGKN